MSEELKPCPFCGEEAELEYFEKDGGWYVYCAAPYGMCEIRPETGLCVTKEDAIAAWNRRANNE